MALCYATECRSAFVCKRTGSNEVCSPQGNLLLQALPTAQYDSETAAYLAQQGTPQHGPQEGTPTAAALQSTPFHGLSASYPGEAASMAPPGSQLTQTVQMSMPHELDTSYYGWPMPYQLPPQQPMVSVGLSLSRSWVQIQHPATGPLCRILKGFAKV